MLRRDVCVREGGKKEMRRGEEKRGDVREKKRGRRGGISEVREKEKKRRKEEGKRKRRGGADEIKREKKKKKKREKKSGR